MATPVRVVVKRFGKPSKDKSVDGTKECDTCKPCTGIVYGPHYDSERDASITLRVFMKTVVADFGKEAWDQAWKKFKCTGKDCSKPESCGPTADYIEIGIENETTTVTVTSGDVEVTVRRPYLLLVRQIRCVADDKKLPKDDTYEPPKLGGGAGGKDGGDKKEGGDKDGK